MSMKMSEAVEVVDIEEVELDNSDSATATPEFKVITISDLENPFTFDDEKEEDEKLPTISPLQAKYMFVCVMISIVMFAVGSLVQSNIHAARVESLIYNAPTETIVVETGDTLWDIASKNSHGKMNVSEFIYYISKINNIKGGSIVKGQVLHVPNL